MNNNKVQSNDRRGCKTFWIIGAGRFGQLAVKRINRCFQGAAITVVDKKLAVSVGEGITTINQDGIDWLATMLDQDACADMIVPAIPVHVAGEWLKLKLSKIYDIKALHISLSRLTQMPNAALGKCGQVITSHADFVCPDDCSEPANFCTHTGRSRPPDMFRLLGDLDLKGVLPIVIRSHQLLPGVGGLYPTEMMRALEIAQKKDHRRLMIATACRCHAVVDFIRLEKRGDAR